LAQGKREKCLEGIAKMEPYTTIYIFWGCEYLVGKAMSFIG